MRGDFGVCVIDGSPAAHVALAALQHRVICGAASARRVAVGSGMKNAFVVVIYDDLSTGDDMKEIEPTPWFELEAHTPVREGWYEVQLTSGDTAFAKFGDGVWTEKPLLVFTHWRGLSADPSKAGEGETESIAAEATAAQGVRAAWNAFFPGLGEEQHKPLDAVPNGKAPH